MLVCSVCHKQVDRIDPMEPYTIRCHPCGHYRVLGSPLMWSKDEVIGDDGKPLAVDSQPPTSGEDKT
jgi:hypothetical protein